MAHQLEIIKNELAQISFDLDCAKSDWKPFIYSLANDSDYLKHIKSIGVPFLDVNFPPT